jgi:hypothetical protein
MMRSPYFPYHTVSAACIFAAVLSACSASDTLQPFSTDGCSLFPDRAPIGRADWCHCCIVHDLAYWRGGTSEARLHADEELKACVRKSSGSAILAQVVFVGVRAGGGPYLPTSYRWGYGWQFGRPYTQLTAEEEYTATRLEQDYRAKSPLLSIPE